MATTFTRKARANRLRTYVAALTISSGLTTTMTAPAQAQDAEGILQDLAGALPQGADIPRLAGAIADAQGEVQRLEARTGKYREDVNRALVDLQDARTMVRQATRGAETAAEELKAAQAAVAEAQRKLDELSRAAYRRSTTSGAVATAAGADEREKHLERRTYLRTQAEKQQEIVTELERQRLEKANRESQLRKAQRLAEVREDKAEHAEADARAVLEDSQRAVDAALAERAELQAQEQAATAALAQARAARQADKPAAPATSGYSATTSVAETETPSAETTPVETVTTSPVPTSAAETPATVTETQVVEAPQPAELAPGSSQAAELIAETQPDHTQFSSLSSESTLQALQNLLIVTAEALSDNAATEEAQLVSDLDGILESLPTVESVTEQASGLMSGTSNSAKIETVIARAQSQVGVPYAWGGGSANGPTRGIRDGGIGDSHGDYDKVGFDCSGLVLYAFAGVGISLPHFTGYQYNHGTKVSPAEMKRGDLVFYGPSGNHHVAIYLGNGMMIESPQSGGVVQVVPVRQSGMSPYAVRLL